ncbi:MAG: winged helix-turn-helix domain-containing protein [Eubacteriales bacterium]|nr:winged helix-turn-helix domain-containing protein [Eubacteriales bacterium]MDD4422262.1 winged helix-turn-helix domain-containing protein [Eubacteriales bacterium]
MVNIKYLRQPGFIFDLIRIFALHFNKIRWNELFVIKNKEQEDCLFYENVLREFPVKTDDIGIFFIYLDNKSCFFLDRFICNNKRILDVDYSIDNFLAEIPDAPVLSQELVDYYLPDSKIKVDLKNHEFYTGLLELIQQQDFSDKMKNMILSFFINPEKAISNLKNEFIEKRILLMQYYQRDYKVNDDFQKDFDLSAWNNRLKKCGLLKKDITGDTDYYISICHIAKNVIKIHIKDNVCLQILGFDYSLKLKESELMASSIHFDVFGKIISDSNRLSIIKMLKNSCELSTSEIAKRLGISLNAVYYHLDMMMQVHMLKSRNEGRTVYYKINEEYFLRAAEAIYSFCTNRGIA